jgi:phosphoribosyl 1,2-cyclic phosphodiesterase
LFVFRALASGSSGNAFVLRTEKVTLLFDAGLRLPLLQKHLAAEGIALEEVSAVLLSHEHRDHCVAAVDIAKKYGIPIVANAEVLHACGLTGLREAETMEVDRPTLFGDVEVTSFPISHDAVRPVGFFACTQGRSIAIATDTGNATPQMLDAIAASDLIVVEANHDVEMLQSGRYPQHLRRRVAGPTGHLSNHQTAGILARCVQRPDVEVWLAHLSKENNTQALALKTVRRTLKAIGLALSVDVAQRDRPSLRWTGLARPQQLSLFGAEAV